MLKKIASVVGTVLLVFVGLFLPDLSSIAVDKHLSMQIKQMKNNEISLSLTNNMEILESVDLFNKLLTNTGDPEQYKSSVVELKEYSQVCRLNEKKVKQFAVEIMNTVLPDGDVQGEPDEAEPILMLGSDGEEAAESGIYWRCLWIDDDAQSVALWIDDNNGQMVHLMVDYTDHSNDEIPQIIYDLGKYCLTHYQADRVQCRKDYDECYVIEVMVKNGEEDFVYPIHICWVNRELIFFNFG